MHHANGKKRMWDDEMSRAKAIQGAIYSDNPRHFVGCINADIAGADVGMHQLDFEHRAEEVDYDGMVEHTACCQHWPNERMAACTYCSTRIWGSGCCLPSSAKLDGSLRYQA
jgi:hypothetical protein